MRAHRQFPLYPARGAVSAPLAACRSHPRARPSTLPRSKRQAVSRACDALFPCCLRALGALGTHGALERKINVHPSHASLNPDPARPPLQRGIATTKNATANARHAVMLRASAPLPNPACVDVPQCTVLLTNAPIHRRQCFRRAALVFVALTASDSARPAAAAEPGLIQRGMRAFERNELQESVHLFDRWVIASLLQLPRSPPHTVATKRAKAPPDPSICVRPALCCSPSRS